MAGSAWMPGGGIVTDCDGPNLPRRRLHLPDDRAHRLRTDGAEVAAESPGESATGRCEHASVRPALADRRVDPVDLCRGAGGERHVDGGVDPLRAFARVSVHESRVRVRAAA